MLNGVKCPWPAMSDDRIKMRQGRKVVSALTPCMWFAHCLWKVVSDIRWEVFLNLNKVAQHLFRKQLSLMNLTVTVMSIIMNYLPKSNGKDNYLKSRFCVSCKNDEMSLRPFWRNTVEMFKMLPLALRRALRWFYHWLVAWSVMLCWIPDHAKSFLQALSLNVFVFDASHWPLQNASFPGDLTGSFVCAWFTLPTWVLNHWLYQCSQQHVMCEVCHCPAVNLLCRFLALKKIIQTVQTPSFLWKLVNWF